LGEPLCPECFDYEAAVLWNAAVSELWRRTTIYLRRRLARSLGLGVGELSSRVRVSYTKVVEYQRRGVVHVHAVVRLDGPDGPASAARGAITTEALVSAVIGAATAVTVPLPLKRDGEAFAAKWGEQVDVREITMRGVVSAGAVAAYVAKYATKSIDAGGQLDHRLGARDVRNLAVRPHLGRLVETAWRLGGRSELADLRLRDWAHTLGFRGHWLTKSLRYSTTFSALRQSRSAWHRKSPDIPAVNLEAVERKRWQFVGQGYTTPGDAWLAVGAAEQHAEAKRTARLDRRPSDREGID
jgi:hypothetical protein